MPNGCWWRCNGSEPRSSTSVDDLTQSDTVFQIGLPPARIDILTGISGVRFEDAWARRTTIVLEGIQVPVLSRDDFIANKRASGRPKDLLDLALIEEADKDR